MKVELTIIEKPLKAQTELINTKGEILTIDHLHKDAENILDWLEGFKNN